MRKSGSGLPVTAALITLVIATSAAGPRADDAAPPPVKPPFEAGDISIGEPIALPFARPKAAVEPTLPAALAVPGQGWLGITVAESKVPGRWIVDDVAPTSPAMAAGISPGDEVRAIGGLPLRNADDVAQALTSISPGEEVRIAIGRGEQISDLTLTAVPRPAIAARSPPNPSSPDGLAPASQAPAFSALTAPPAAEPLATIPIAPPAALAATLPPAALAATPGPALPVAPPAAAFAAAPPINAGVLAAMEASPAAPRFTRESASAEPPASPSTRFEPAPPVMAAEPPARPPQPAPVTGGRLALGVRTIPIDPVMQARFNLPEASGAYVIGVVGDLPASRAGVPPGSVIVALDERPVRSPDELTRLVASGRIGESVPLEYVLPGGASRRADVVLQALEQPLEEALVGLPEPLAARVPTLQPQPQPTLARRPAADDQTTALRLEIRQLEARLEALEQRLTDR